MVRWIVKGFLSIAVLGLVYYCYPEHRLPRGVKIDKLVVVKSERIMLAFSRGELVKTYEVSLGRNPIGDKEFRGDNRTPEGEYTINDRNPNSQFYKNLGISYPIENDIEDSRNKELDPGGEIKIHGLRNGFAFIGKFHRLLDWTAGCIAVTDEEMDELYESVDVGASITIRP